MNEIKLRPQAAAVLQLLRDFGNTTVREAQDALGMTEVRSRISDLVKAGYPIVKKWESGRNKFGEPRRFIRYYLEEDNEQD